MSKYKCHICDKVFSWCYTLTLHLRKKHELKWPSGHSRFRYVYNEADMTDCVVVGMTWCCTVTIKGFVFVYFFVDTGRMLMAF